MEWLNIGGLIFVAWIMIPNIVFAIKCKGGFENRWQNKWVACIEQIVRCGSQRNAKTHQPSFAYVSGFSTALLPLYNRRLSEKKGKLT